MRQHVGEPTHIGGHTLDVVITRDTDNVVSNVEVTGPGLFDSSGKVARDNLAVICSVVKQQNQPLSVRLFHSENIVL